MFGDSNPALNPNMYYNYYVQINNLKASYKLLEIISEKDFLVRLDILQT